MENNNDESSNDSKMMEYFSKNSHRIRNCSEYKLEYKMCTSIRGRFHQYFIFGENLDCTEFKENWKDCESCNESLDYKACCRVIDRENIRKKKRIETHQANDVWEKRSEPPLNWNSELPDWAKEQQKDSFLEVDNTNSCIIF